MGLSQRRTQLVGRLRHRKTREREEQVLVEGVRAVDEALAAGADGAFAVCSPRLEALDGGGALLGRLGGAGVEVVRVDDRELAALSDTEHPQGVLLVCRQPAGDHDLIRAHARLLVLDGIQDPGNVGALVRAAVAFDLDGVVALDGTADPWGAKAVRSSVGMAFRLPIVQLGADDAVARLREAGLPILVADAAGSDVRGVRRGGGWALAVGNEGSGPRRALREAAHALISIPMPGGAESLNAGVAGAILTYALTREEQGAR